MKYREIKPIGFLSNFVQCFWEYESTEIEIEHTILPDGFFDLIVEFSNKTIKRIVLTGVWTKPVSIKYPNEIKIFAIRFKLLASEYLFQQELKSILNTNKQLPLDLWNIRNYHSNEFEKFTTEITYCLENSIKHLKEIDNRKLRLFNLAYSSKAKTVNEISKNVFWSSRQINRYFNNQFGFSLKEFLKIVRFKSSYEHLSNGELYPQNEYFDQAHFIKEVKKYSGTTPKELSKNKNDRFIQLSRTETG